jgi:hypothetical protein
MEWFLNIIKELVNAKFTGRICINFSDGNIGNINKEETIRPPK